VTMSPAPKAVQYIPPGQRRRQPRALAVLSYRLTLTRESDGAVMQEWSGIPHDRVGPMLQAIQHYTPWLGKVAAAKEAWEKLVKLFQ
jgi:hypothetical protein